MSGCFNGRALVVGRGASGIAAAALLRRQGRDVLIADEHAMPGEPGSDVPVRSRLQASDLAGIELAVVSPGFAIDHPWLRLIRKCGVRLVPEFEFGMAALPGVRVVAVTGSNGKSSLVKWVADALVAHGVRAVPAGNYGRPPSDLALSDALPEVVVLELSSFQLEQSVDFHAEISVLLNFAPNHLDRHGTMEMYARAKARIFAGARPGDLLIAHAAAWAALAPWLPRPVTPVLIGDGGHWDQVAESAVAGTWWGRPPLSTNAAAACAIFDRFGIGLSAVRASAAAFAPLPHRMEHVAEVDGVRYVNDSKASTLTALAAALEALPGKKHLIAGGILKESDPGLVKEVLAKHAAFVYVIGSAAPALFAAWRDVVPCENCGDLTTAFSRAAARAGKSETVLLSPGCSSFDQFSSYGQRGEVFKTLVQKRASQQ